MAMARASSGLQYPERFYAAASYVGFDGSTSPTKSLTSKFSNSTALLLYSLYQQVTSSLSLFARIPLVSILATPIDLNIDFRLLIMPLPPCSINSYLVGDALRV